MVLNDLKNSIKQGNISGGDHKNLKLKEINWSVALFGLLTAFSRPKPDLLDFAHLKISLLLSFVGSQM